VFGGSDKFAPMLQVPQTAQAGNRYQAYTSAKRNIGTSGPGPKGTNAGMRAKI
jgi:hypothetical protein